MSQTPGSFPQAMAPLGLAQTGFRNSDFHFEGMSRLSQGQVGMASWTAQVDELGFAARRFLQSKLPDLEKVITGHVSRLHEVTLSAEDLEDLGIEAGAAAMFAFSHPVAMLQELQVSQRDMSVPDIALLVFGGFMYFDSDLCLRDVRALVPGDGAVGGGLLRFRAPQPWRLEWTEALGVHRWRPVTVPALRAVGARYFCWFLPGEALPGGGEAFTDNGGFAFLFHDPGETAVLQASFDTFFAAASKAGDEAVCAPQGKPCPTCARPLEWSDFDAGPYAIGWDCEHLHVCGMRAATAGRHRWCCPVAASTSATVVQRHVRRPAMRIARARERRSPHSQCLCPPIGQACLKCHS